MSKLMNWEDVAQLNDFKTLNRSYVYNLAESIYFKLNVRIRELESRFSSYPKYAYRYARDVIEGRFEEAEPVIARDAYYAYYYARDVIKDRFHEAEPVIAQDAEYKDDYNNLMRELGIDFRL